jgi:hypothetical protein
VINRGEGSGKGIESLSYIKCWEKLWKKFWSFFCFKGVGRLLAEAVEINWEFSDSQAILFAYLQDFLKQISNFHNLHFQASTDGRDCEFRPGWEDERKMKIMKV